MVLVSTIDIDLASQTAILNATSGGNLVENIRYDFLTNTITNAERGQYTITGTEFLQLNVQRGLLQAAILRIFPVSIFDTIPFGIANTIETHDFALNQWNLTSQIGDIPLVIEYVADYSSGNIILEKRSPEKVITFPEWVYVLGQLTHYTASVKAFLNL